MRGKSLGILTNAYRCCFPTNPISHTSPCGSSAAVHMSIPFSIGNYSRRDFTVRENTPTYFASRHSWAKHSSVGAACSEQDGVLRKVRVTVRVRVAGIYLVTRGGLILVLLI